MNLLIVYKACLMAAMHKDNTDHSDNSSICTATHLHHMILKLKYIWLSIWFEAHFLAFYIRTSVRLIRTDNVGLK